MATKDACLSLIDKQASYVGDSSANNIQYNSLNLNHNNERLSKVNESSKSFINDSRKEDRYDFTIDSQTNKEDYFRDKFMKSNFLEHIYPGRKKIYQKEFGYKKKNSRNSNSSTLSLHIAAYEKSVEGICDPNNGSENVLIKKEQKGSIKKWHSTKQLLKDSTSNITNSFEYPRQQKDKDAIDPEVMQFKTSQKLLNPNQSTTNSDLPDNSQQKDKFIKLLQPGTLIAKRWLIQSIVGKGEFGSILAVVDKFKVHDSSLALKIESNCDEGTIAHESTIMSILNRNGFFPNLHAVGRKEYFSYIVMDLEGISLAQFQKNGIFFSRFSQTVIFIQLLAGLKELHSLGVVHRDLKTENIVLNQTGTMLKLIDFGLSRMFMKKVDGELKRKEQRSQCSFTGNMLYASPHAMSNGEQGPVDDLFGMLYVGASLQKLLPWNQINGPNKFYNTIISKQLKTNSNLFNHNNDKFSRIIKHLKNLSFCKSPNYDFIHSQLKSILSSIYSMDNPDLEWAFSKTNKPQIVFADIFKAYEESKDEEDDEFPYACSCLINCRPIIIGERIISGDEEMDEDQSLATVKDDNSLKDNSEFSWSGEQFEHRSIVNSDKSQSPIKRPLLSVKEIIEDENISERKIEMGSEPTDKVMNIYPTNELDFKGPFTDVVTSPLSISNPTEKTIAFKMMATAPNHYCCRPNIGYVRPGDTVELQIMVEPMEDEKKIEREKHKFMIQYVYVKDAPGDSKSQASQVDEPKAPYKELPPAVDFWAKSHNKNDIVLHKFTVAFHQQTMTKDKLDGILMDLTSRAAAEAAAEMERERRLEEAERKERERLLKKGKITPEERARLEVLLALQALALAKQKLTGILHIVPAEKVLFLGPFSEYACATIRLTNPSSKHIYYKVLVTNPKHYIIKPSFGILKPGETAISVVIIEQQDVYSNIEKKYSQLVENLVLHDKFMVHAAYANDGSTPIPDFWKKREQGSVYAHKLRIALHLLNAEETVKERERRDKLKAAGYKNKELILSGIYGRDSGLNNYYGKDAFGGPVLPYPDDGPNPYDIGASPAGAGAATTPVGASGAGFDGNRDPSNMKQPGGGGVEQRPVSAYGGGPLGGPGGSVRAMDAPAGGGGGSGPGGANNINNNSPGYNPNMIMGPGGARGGSVMLGPGGGPDGTKSGYAAPGNAYMYAGGGNNNYGGATGGGAAAGNNYGGNAAGGNYGGAGGGNYDGASGANIFGGVGSANNRPASAYGGGPLGGAGGSVSAMDYGGGAGGQSGEGGAAGYNAGGGNYGGAGGANNSGGDGGANGANNGPAGSANNRPASSNGGDPLGGPGGSVRAMDTKAGGGNPGYSSGPGVASGGANGSSGANDAGGQTGSANNRPASSYGGGPLGGPGGSVRAADYGGSLGGNAGNAGGNANNAGLGGANAGGGGGPPGGSVMFCAPGGGTNSGYAAPGGGYMYGGGSGGGNADGSGGTGGGPSGGGGASGSISNPTQDGP